MRIPRPIKWVSTIVLTFLVLFTLFRVVFYLRYHNKGTAFPSAAFGMGLKFDIRIACILGVFLLLLCAIPVLNPFRNLRIRRFWIFLLCLFVLITLIFYTTDFYHYDYLQQRLAGSVLNFLQDAAISSKMVWQTYPVIWILILIIVVMALFTLLFKRILYSYTSNSTRPVSYTGLWYTVFLILLGWGIWGSSSQFALRWSNVFSLQDNFQAELALNPFQSFFSTLKFRKSSYDAKQVAANYSSIADYLGVKDKDSTHLNYKRTIGASPFYSLPPNANVVLVICESFSAFKSSMWGNPLNTTPYFKSMCDSGVFFTNCFTPAHGTARGVWGTLTGLPDVELSGTASRNMAIVDQHILMNDFKNYEKYYFIGGSASWANIRGLLHNNIEGLHLVEQDDIQGSKINVWGVSDKNLFLEANKTLSQQTKPFFAIIQTADNHRPYTIPSEDMGAFKTINMPEDTLLKYGFASNDELNAFRYTDFCYQRFMEAAKQSPYYKNTVFVFVGDHGIKGDAGEMLPQPWTTESLTMFHVPLLFYCPAYLKPERENIPCSQVDILPSICSITKTPVTYTAMGKNLFDSTLYDPFRWNSTFIFNAAEGNIGMVWDNYYYHEGIDGKQQKLSFFNGTPPPGSDTVQSKLKRMARAYFETSRYLLYNNKKPR